MTAVGTRELKPDKLLVVAGLFGPAAWTVFIVVTYLLEDPLACMPGASAKGQILGVGVRTIAGVVSVALASATFVVGAVSLLAWRRLRTSNSTGRRPWMALAGFLNSVLFGAVMLAGLAPAIMLRTCTPSP
jgi:hypothetical protein